MRYLEDIFVFEYRLSDREVISSLKYQRIPATKETVAKIRKDMKRRWREVVSDIWPNETRIAATEPYTAVNPRYYGLLRAQERAFHMVRYEMLTVPAEEGIAEYGDPDEHPPQREADVNTYCCDPEEFELAEKRRELCNIIIDGERAERNMSKEWAELEALPEPHYPPRAFE